VRLTPTVALLLLDPEDPYEYVTVQGPVVELIEDGAPDDYRKLARRYTGETDRYERRYGDEGRFRVICKIEPGRTTTLAIED
jgi:hypothetical protein